MINRGEVGPAHRPVLIQEQPGTVEAAVLVQFLGFFEILRRLIGPLLLLEDQRRVKPGGGIVRVQLFGPANLRQSA